MTSQQEINDTFVYIDGSLYWKTTGKKAGIKTTNGYIAIWWKHVNNYEHRLIFMMLRGYLPELIDHKDTHPDNNAIDNLRPSNKSTNAMNRSAQKNSKSGIKGISWDSEKGMWVGRITVKQKLVWHQRFNDLEIATTSIVEARKELHGEFNSN